MKCTKCNNEMELGYIQCRDGVYWSKNKRLLSAVCLSPDAIPLSGVFEGGTVEAYNCQTCKQIIIKY